MECGKIEQFFNLVLYTTYLFFIEIIGLHVQVMAFTLVSFGLYVFFFPFVTISSIYMYLFIFIMTNTITKMGGIQYEDTYSIVTICTTILWVIIQKMEHISTPKKNKIVTVYLCLNLIFQSKSLSIYELDHTLAIVFKYFLMVILNTVQTAHTHAEINIYEDFVGFLFIYFMEEIMVPFVILYMFFVTRRVTESVN